MPSQTPDPRQSLDPKKSPKARLGKHLRRLRLAAGYTTQAAAAARIDGYGEDSVQKAETGNVVPGDDLYAKLLNLYEATDTDRVYLDELLEQAREDKSGVPAFFAEYERAEVVATFLRLWGLPLVPGPLQTREYAHAVHVAVGMDEDEAAEQADLRVKRRAKVDGPNAAQVTALIYESLLDVLVGTPETIIGQLESLLAASLRRNVIIQVVPAGAFFPGLAGQFEIATGPTIADIVDMVNVEDQVTDGPAVVSKVVAWFEQIRGSALNVTDSRKVLTEALQRWKSRQQRTQAGASPAIALPTAARS